MGTLAQILRVARAGSPARAWEMFEQGGWNRRGDDVDALSLKGRLLKDRAKAADASDRAGLFRESAAAYRAAADLEAATYPLINAASLELLAGRADEAGTLARRTLALLDTGEHEPETAYWLAATRAEALLLLDRDEEAQAVMADAIAKAPRAWEDHAATLGQFALILAEQGKDAAWLDRHRPPRSVHFQGIMGIAPDDETLHERLDDWLTEIAPGFGFGALAAGADILVAEALQRSGAELHIVLPCAPDLFRERSVVAVDARWGPRFDALIDAAETVESLDAAAGPSRAAVALCEEAAMGLALRHARNLASEAAALCITDPTGRLPNTAELWRRRGGRLTVIETERSAAVPEHVQGQDQDLVALLALDALDSGAFETVAERGLWRMAVDSAIVIGFDDPHEALAALHAANGTIREATRAVLDYGLADDGRISARRVRRLSKLAQATAPGQVLASRPAALALSLISPDLRIEEAGELRWEGGDIPVFSISGPVRQRD